MKRLWKTGCILLVALLLLAAFAGCSAKSMASEESWESDYTAAEMPPVSEPTAAKGEMGWDAAASGSVAETTGQTQQKIIKNAWLSLETRRFDQAMEELERSIKELGGYVESSNVDGRKPQQWSDSGRYASLCVRIPAERLEEFLSEAGTLFDVVSQGSNTENVTTQYYDAEARKKSYEIQLERLEGILAESAELADVLALETEIARVRYEIETLTTQLRGLDNQVSYSTVNLDIRELNGFERPQAAEQTLGERMSSAFTESFHSAGEALKDFVVFLSGSLPALALWAAIIVLAVVIYKKIRRRRKESGAPEKKGRKAKTEQEKTSQSLTIEPDKTQSAPEKTEEQKGDSEQ